eukprot:CAMPEP_0172839048 /NCGR_PEP_ID=MMETSP1075-20121228/28292_1 /TAXON_ID=2916 /ORGANISM="Ceratium fusus, Strain PA161109" /LENGTH=251 /DNA_ID=CAMNT_0013682643 /DNA_START=45 /DNA_END=797 /DNA_ORIENTATION=+
MEHVMPSPNHGPFGQAASAPLKQSPLASAGREETLPRLAQSNGSSTAPVLDGKLKSSRAPSPQQPSLSVERSTSPGSEDEEDAAPERPEPISPLKSGVDDHRADPALRVALEHLDAVRQRQPNMDGFGIERYLGHVPVPTPADDEASWAVPREHFSLDALLAAAQAPSLFDASRSTSFGSTQGSLLSSGTTASSGASSVGGTGRNRIGPRRPLVAPVPQQQEEALAETPLQGLVLDDLAANVRAQLEAGAP